MLINYKMNDGYCINNVSNHYILTKDEKKSLEKNSLMNSSINILKVTIVLIIFLILKDLMKSQ